MNGWVLGKITEKNEWSGGWMMDEVIYELMCEMIHVLDGC